MKIRYFVLINNIFLLSTFFFCTTGFGATSITANMTVDDNFDLYLSTDDTQVGTYVGSGSIVLDSWTTASTFTFNLTPGITNYIHIVGWDIYRTKAALLGEFSLSDSSFFFDNGTQNLLTDSTNWNISDVGFGQSYYAPDAIALNDGSNWPVISGISSNAYWIWSNQGLDLYPAQRYFSTQITPIPVPSGIILGGIGAGFAGWLRRRRTI